MCRLFSLAAVLLLLGTGCRSVTPSGNEVPTATESVDATSAPTLALPVSEYNANFKRFGEHIEDRFTGYHTAEDVEFSQGDLAMHGITEIPVYAIADGAVSYRGWVGGYGGVIIIRHQIDGETVSALYGHVDVGEANTLAVGDVVAMGQQIAMLGADRSQETDGERQHLHFALWNGEEVKLAGYVPDPDQLSGWLNPHDVLVAHGALPADDPANLLASANFWFPEPPREDGSPRSVTTLFDNVPFAIPEGWDVQWVASEPRVLTLYAVSGEGSADARAQVLLRVGTNGSVTAERANDALSDAMFDAVAASLSQGM